VQIERNGEALETREPRERGPRWAGMLLALALLALGSMGCTATVVSRPRVYGYVVADAGPMPANVATYDYVYYRGAPAYWVDGSWYYQSSGGWVVFVDEPRDLYYTRVSMRNRTWATAQYGVRTGGSVVRTTPSRRGGYVQASPTVRRAPVRPASPEQQALQAPSRRSNQKSTQRPTYRPPSKASPSQGRSSKPSKTIRSKPPARTQRRSRGR
jgi:hypothetical protein